MVCECVCVCVVCQRGYNAILSLDGTHMHVCIVLYVYRIQIKNKTKNENKNVGTMREKCTRTHNPTHLDLIKKIFIFAIKWNGIHAASRRMGWRMRRENVDGNGNFRVKRFAELPPFYFLSTEYAAFQSASLALLASFILIKFQPIWFMHMDRMYAYGGRHTQKMVKMCFGSAALVELSINWNQPESGNPSSLSSLSRRSNGKNIFS